MTDLVTSPNKGFGETMLKKVPTMLMALYEIDCIEESVVVEWHKQAPGTDGTDDAAGKKVRAAAAPFIKWLATAEESGGEESQELPSVS